jgi:hypothetical protein
MVFKENQNIVAGGFYRKINGQQIEIYPWYFQDGDFIDIQNNTSIMLS